MARDADFGTENWSGIYNAAEIDIRSAGDITCSDLVCHRKKDTVARQKEAGQGYHRVPGRHLPAMTMAVLATLVEDDALIEIEATAVLAVAKSG